MHKIFRRFAAILSAVLTMVVPVIVLAPAAHADGAVLELDHTVVANAVESTDATVPSGGTFTYVIKYKCASTTTACTGAVITDVFPSGLSLSNPAYSTDVVSANTTDGRTWTFTMANPLAAGSTGQITMSATVPEWHTPNGVVFDNFATMTASNAASVTSPSSHVTARADVSSRTQKFVIAGGAIDEQTTYVTYQCLSSTGDPAEGPLAIAEGSQVIDTLPPRRDVRLGHRRRHLHG